MQRTHVVQKERSPEWNRVFRLASGSLATDMLRVSVLHEGSANMNEVIGEVWIRLAELWKQSWADPIAPSLRRVARQAFVLKDAQENVVTSFEDYGNGKETRNACVNLAFSIALPPRDVIPMHGWAAIKTDADALWERAWLVLDPFQQLLRLWSDGPLHPTLAPCTSRVHYQCVCKRIC